MVPDGGPHFQGHTSHRKDTQLINHQLNELVTEKKIKSGQNNYDHFILYRTTTIIIWKDNNPQVKCIS